MWNILTLDGCFEGLKSWELYWHPYVWGPELERFSLDQLHTADWLLFGRVTYEGMAAYWQTQTGEVADFMNRLPEIVFSRSLAVANWEKQGLFDEYRLAVAPVLLGRGRALFGPNPHRTRLRLLEAKPLSNGCVILRYEPDRTPTDANQTPV